MPRAKYFNETTGEWEHADIAYGSASIDVTASVGQTIVVEEVDANGKPTKWKAAEYQPRTHWSEETVVLPETAGVYSDDTGGFTIPFVELTGGAEYKMVYNGVEYVSGCLDGREDGVGEILFGNIPLLMETGDNGCPFMGAMATDGEAGMGVVMPLDDAETCTLSITEVKTTPIPVQYVTNAFPYYIEVTGSGTTDDPYVCNDSVANVEAIYDSGRSIVVKAVDTVGVVVQMMPLCWTFDMRGAINADGDGNGIVDNTSFSAYGVTFQFIGLNYASGSAVRGSQLYFSPKQDGTYLVSKDLSE